MIDIHAHILPDLDDVSEDMEESLEMAELAVESGVEIMAATPHSNQMGRFENFQSEQLQTAFERLRMVLKKEKIPLKILNGMEIFASEDIAQKIKNKQHRAAGYGHRPVRVAAENYLDEVVYYRAEEKDKDIAKSVFQYHHRAYF